MIWFSIPAAACLTKKGVPCHFPFRYKGTKYAKCVKWGNADSWCSTDLEFSKDSYGTCSTNCPIENGQWFEILIHDVLTYYTKQCIMLTNVSYSLIQCIIVLRTDSMKTNLLLNGMERAQSKVTLSRKTTGHSVTTVNGNPKR